MKKLLLFTLTTLLISCETFNTLTIVDKQMYFNEEAVIAYEFYKEVYKNDTTNSKPIIFMKEY